MQANLFTGAGIEAVVQGYFQDFWQVEVAGQDIAFGAESPHFDAAATATVTGVFQAFPLI